MVSVGRLGCRCIPSIRRSQPQALLLTRVLSLQTAAAAPECGRRQHPDVTKPTTGNLHQLHRSAKPPIAPRAKRAALKSQIQGLIAQESSRAFSSSSAGGTQQENDGKNETSTPTKLTRAEWQDEIVKGVGQVIFLPSRDSGVILTLSLLVGNPYVTGLGLLGSATSIALARAVLEVKDLNQGLWAYNGALMGCMSAVFVAPMPAEAFAWTAAGWGTASTLAGASAATLTTALLPKVLPTGMPQWTVAFNLVALTQLVRVQPLLTHTTEESFAPEHVVTVSNMLQTPLLGLSHIFVVESPLTGLGIVAALYQHSPRLAAHAVVGSAVGALTAGLALGVPLDQVESGLWSFNSALTSLGVGVFFCHSRATVALSVVGAAATAVVYGGMKSAFFHLGASPCLTLPFCTTMSACWLLAHPIIPSLHLAAEPHSPEKNQPKAAKAD